MYNPLRLFMTLVMDICRWTGPSLVTHWRLDGPIQTLRTWSTFFRVMACCLMATSWWQQQAITWIIADLSLMGSFSPILQENLMTTISKMSLKLKITVPSLWGRWVKNAPEIQVVGVSGDSIKWFADEVEDAGGQWCGCCHGELNTGWYLLLHQHLHALIITWNRKGANFRINRNHCGAFSFYL